MSDEINGMSSTESGDGFVLPIGDSVLASWIRSICQTVRGYGVDPEQLMERVGLDVSLLTVPEARYPAMNVRRFWEATLSACGDDLLGLRCGQEMQVPALHGLGLAIITSRSLAQVLELMARYCKVISSTMDMSLSHDVRGTTLKLRTLRGNESRNAALLTVMAFVARQASSLSQHAVKPVAVTFACPRGSAQDRRRLEEYFECPVEMGEDIRTSIRFSYEDVMQPYASANAMLREANERVVTQYLNCVRRASFAVRVEEEIQSLLASGDSSKISVVAQRLNLSARTLQRRLETEGVTYAELLEKHRRKLAHDALAHTEQSISKIAYSLGFSDPSNFSRTCYRWFGVSPVTYRRRIRQLPT